MVTNSSYTNSEVRIGAKKFSHIQVKKYGCYHYVKFASYYFKIKLYELESFEDRRTNVCHYFYFDLLSRRVDAFNILA